MSAMSTEVTFTVETEVETRPNQSVCLVGDADVLGAWDPCRGINLERKVSSLADQWICKVTLQQKETYKYRFYVCKENQLSASDSTSCATRPLTVVKWETNVKAREIITTDSPRQELPVSTFGEDGGCSHIGKGWLINQSEVQLRLHSNPIHMWKAKHQMQSYSVKCLAMDYAATEGMTVTLDEDSRDGPPPFSAADVLVSALSEPNSRPTSQSPWGQHYKQDDYLVFRTQVDDLHNVGFQLDFFVREDKESSRFVGSSHILPFNSPETRQNRRLPIIGCNHKPIGKVTVDMLVVRPVRGVTCSMETSYQSYWKYRELGSKSLDIGHRGMGSSYAQFNMLKENTVASFSSAAQHGADFVEFDVLLSKDKQPVIYHDFTVHVSYSTHKKDHTVETELFEIPVHSLTLSQLQSIKLFSSGEKAELNHEQDDQLNTQPFPTLERCLREVDGSIGFNIEIKYPQQLQNDNWEAENYLDLNEHLDQILRVIFANAGGRKIIFSCFDPDTTILLQLKQNKYPIMFLHQGQNSKWEHFKDYRANKVRNGIKFAISEQLLGVVLLSECLLQDPSIIQDAKEEGMVVFVWGDENNDPNMIRTFRQLNVDGIIYDRIDRHKPEHHAEFELQSAKDEVIFKALASTDNCASVHTVTVSK